jgi:CHASE3 domain sensor protein
MLRTFAATIRRVRSVSFSIGQLTFGSFALLLAMIAMTSIASVVAIHHIDATFSELQHLRSLGEAAEEIDRRTKELRLAARDLVTNPAAPSDRVWEAASSLSALLKNTRLQLAPEQQEMIDGVTLRLANYRDGMERITALIARRAELVSALPPVRARFEQAISEIPDRATARALFRAQNRLAAALLRSFRFPTPKLKSPSSTGTCWGPRGR